MITLAIETSTNEGSVALFRDEELLFSNSFQSGRSHSSILFVALEKALAVAPIGAEDQIVVGLGPGSYAGVRIGISAAVGLSVATGAKLVGIPSIATLGGGRYLALGDARRETYYFAKVDEGACLEGPILVTAEELAAKLSATESEWRRISSESLPLVPGLEIAFPSAVRLGQLAVAGRSVIARDHLEPVYLRDPHITLPKPRNSAGRGPNSPPFSLLDRDMM